MSETITTIELPTDLDWGDVGDGPGTCLGVTVKMWGVTFYVDAFAVDESGEALCAAGARVLKSVREIDDYEQGATYQTIPLTPDHNFMVVFTPCRALESVC